MTAIRSLGHVLVLGTILLGSSLPAFSQTDPRPNENSGAAGVSTTPRETSQAKPPQTELPAQSTSDPAGRAPSGAADTRPTENPAEPEAHGTRLRWHDLPKNILHDQKAIITSPFRINRQKAKWWILFGGATAALIATDRRVSDALPDRGSLLGVSKWASRMGADYSIYPIAAAFYVAGKIGDNPRARDASRIGIEAIADAEITVNILKAITQRPRPEHRGASIAFWSGGDAFPSGHSIKSFALARVIAREFPHPRIVPFLAYGLASTVSIARIGGRRHSPSDALVGSAMGFFIGDYVYRHHHTPSNKATVISWLASHVSLEFVVTVTPAPSKCCGL